MDGKVQSARLGAARQGDGMNARAALLLLAESRELFIPAAADEPVFLELVESGLAGYARSGKIGGYYVTAKGREDVSPHRQQEARP